MSSILRTNKGRRKIEMKKMTNESNLQVTFSKRRSGIFKKTSELCTLCGAEVGLIIFSPADKVFSFGHPNVKTILHRYLTGGPPHATQFMGANLHELNVQLAKFTSELKIEMKRNDELKRLRKVIQTQWWWATPTNEMTIMQLNEFKATLQQLKINTTRQSKMIPIMNAKPTLFFAGSSSSNTVSPMNNHGLEEIEDPMNHHSFNNMVRHDPNSGFNSCSTPVPPTNNCGLGETENPMNHRDFINMGGHAPNDGLNSSSISASSMNNHGLGEIGSSINHHDFINIGGHGLNNGFNSSSTPEPLMNNHGLRETQNIMNYHGLINMGGHGPNNYFN